jgi:hypothetical protein
MDFAQPLGAYPPGLPFGAVNQFPMSGWFVLQGFTNCTNGDVSQGGDRQEGIVAAKSLRFIERD